MNNGSNSVFLCAGIRISLPLFQVDELQQKVQNTHQAQLHLHILYLVAAVAGRIDCRDIVFQA